MNSGFRPIDFAYFTTSFPAGFVKVYSVDAGDLAASTLNLVRLFVVCPDPKCFLPGEFSVSGNFPVPKLRIRSFESVRGLNVAVEFMMDFVMRPEHFRIVAEKCLFVFAERLVRGMKGLLNAAPVAALVRPEAEQVISRFSDWEFLTGELDRMCLAFETDF